MRNPGLHLNLATHPARNRRFFWVLVAGLALLTAGLWGWGAYTYGTFAAKNKAFAGQKAQIEAKMRRAQREERRLAARIEDAIERFQERVDLINTLIYRKSFSWVEFLSALEEALPRRCVIVSMAPNLKEDSRIEVRLRVRAPRLEDLLELNRNLYEKAFTNIRSISESRTETGQILAEISLVYERTF
ncbi:MAG: hypothetical protein ACE5LV_04495 [Candidatus Aminicenantales bacterium]